jgi:hypothetical protein
MSSAPNHGVANTTSTEAARYMLRCIKALEGDVADDEKLLGILR